MELIIHNILIMAGIALLAAVVLYFVSKKFVVAENLKVAEVLALLPGVNCGACGKAGCAAFAQACTEADAVSFGDLYCAPGGRRAMDKIASSLGFQSKEKQKTAAVLKCRGTCSNAPDKIVFSGLKSCRLLSQISVGKSGCPNGCLRFGDCLKVCKFAALHIDPEWGIPVVDTNKCVSCGACVAACPRTLFELRPASPDGSMVYVACSNRQKGAVARQNCKVACIACTKCTKVDGRIKIADNLSYIPSDIDAALHGEELRKTCPTTAIVHTRGDADE